MEDLKDLSARIAEMEKDFAEKQRSVDAMPTVPPETPTDKKIKELKRQKQEAAEKLTEARKQKARILLTQAKQKKREINLEIGKLRFPDSVSDDHARRSVGEQQVQSALILLSKSESHEVIISAMQNAVNVNRIDFASTLLDKILNSAPVGILDTTDEDPFTALPSEKKNIYYGEGNRGDENSLKRFCRTLVEIYDSLGNKEELDKLNKELRKVLSIETQLKKIIDPPVQQIASLKTKAGIKVKSDESAPSEKQNVYNPEEDKARSVEIEPLESNLVSQ
jgi:hypothetical protein